MRSDRITRARLCWLAALVAAAGACRTPSVDAVPPPYNPTTLTSGILYHWPVGNTINFHVVPGPASGEERLADAVRIAMGQWAAVLAYREHSLRLVDDLAAADVVVRDTRVPAPVETDCAGSGWVEGATTAVFCPLGDSARTLMRLDGGPGRAKVLISIDVAAGEARIAGLMPVVVHEVGHALGIGGHSDVSTDVMFGIPGMRVPSRNDALTLRYVLHRRPDLTL